MPQRTPIKNVRNGGLGWILTGSLLLPYPPLMAKNIACDSIGGAVVFKDMFYGIGIGALFSGLVIAAQDNYDKSGQKVAQGALVGASLGLGLGIFEVSTRTCEESGQASPSSTARWAATDPSSAWRFSWRPNFETSSLMLTASKTIF